MIRPDDARHNRRNAPTRYATDWDAYGRSCARQRETLDPAMQMRPIPPRLMRALCKWLDAPKLKRAA